MTDRILNLNFIENGAIVQFHEKSVANGSLFGFVIFDAEPLVFYTVDLRSKGVYAWIGSGLISAICHYINNRQMMATQYSLALAR